MSFADDYVAQIERLGGFEPLWKSYFRWILDTWDQRHPRKEKHMPLFEVAFVRVPPVAEQEQGASEKLLGGPYAVVAKDQEGAVATATIRLGKDDADVEIDSTTKILVRPFS